MKLGQWSERHSVNDWVFQNCTLIDDRETDTQFVIQQATANGQMTVSLNMETDMDGDMPQSIGININKADRDRIVAVLQGIRFPDEVDALLEALSDPARVENQNADVGKGERLERDEEGLSRFLVFGYRRNGMAGTFIFKSASARDAIDDAYGGSEEGFEITAVIPLDDRDRRFEETLNNVQSGRYNKARYT